MDTSLNALNTLNRSEQRVTARHFCPGCGQRVEGNALFCGRCGISASDKTEGRVVNLINRGYIDNRVYVTVNPAPVSPAPAARPKSAFAAFLLCMLGGPLGLHRFYTGKLGTGLVWLLTGGLYGVGWVIDLLRIVTGHFDDKLGRKLC